MYIRLLGLWRSKQPFCKQGMRSIVSGSSPQLQLSLKCCLWWLSPGLSTPAFEWFSLFHSARGSACVGGIDRPRIGLRRTWLLMSVCARSHGTPEAPRAKQGRLTMGERWRCCIARWIYIYQCWLQNSTPTHILYTNDTWANCQQNLILFL